MSDAAGGAASYGALARFPKTFTTYARDPDQSQCPPRDPHERMKLYSRLVFGDVERVMSNMCPVLKSRVPEAY